MSLFVPPVLPQALASNPAQALQQNQAPTAVQAAAAVTAVPVGGQQTRMAATASGNSGGSAAAKGEKGKKADNQAAATEARTDTRPRGLGRKADLSV
jgi:hypothetical protein